jgi:nucleoside-diphosphate-sugar epimerase
MKVLFTGTNGALGKLFVSMYQDTVQASVRYSDEKSFMALVEQIKTADVLIHASANLNPGDIESGIRDNALLTYSIVNAAGKVNSNCHLILISSMSILGEDGEPKQIRDMTHYAASKYIMEELAWEDAKNPITVVRFSTLFYEDPSRDGLSKMVYSAVKNKNIVASDCKRDFIPLWAACKWLNKLCGNPVWYNKTINLASGKPINMLDVANHLVSQFGVSFHHTALPDYANVCYKFSADAANTLEQINFDIYDLIDKYYERLQKGN